MPGEELPRHSLSKHLHSLVHALVERKVAQLGTSLQSRSETPNGLMCNPTVNSNLADLKETIDYKPLQ